MSTTTSLPSRAIRRLRRAGSPVKQALLRRLGRRPGGRKPVLGVVGFFGHGNYGDELFWSVFEQYFGDDYELRLLPDLLVDPYFSTPAEERVKGVDAIIMGGGDLLHPWTQDKRYWAWSYLEKPLFIVGIGVPQRPKDAQYQDKQHIIERHRSFLRHPNVKFIGVRDEASRKWVVDKIAPVVPVHTAPDIVCSLDLPAATAPATPTLSIVTRLRKAGQLDDYTQLARLAEHVRGQGWKVQHLMLGTGVVGERDVADSVNLDIPDKVLVQSEDLDELSRAIGGSTALASMKFHGSVVATMYGVPSIVLIPTSKNRSFMDRIGRKDLLARFDDPSIIDRFDPAPAAISPAHREMLRDGADHIMRRVRGMIDAEVGLRR